MLTKVVTHPFTVPLLPGLPKLLRSDLLFFCQTDLCRLLPNKVLLENEADIDAMDIYGETPLSEAAYNGHLDVVEVNLNRASAVRPAFILKSLGTV